MKKLICHIKDDHSFDLSKDGLRSSPSIKIFNLDDLEVNQCEISNGIFFLKNKDYVIVFAIPVNNLLFYEIVEEKENGSV